MTRARKTAAQVREEACRLVRLTAVEREKTGDPEGAELLRDLARDIKAIRLTAPPATPPTDPYADASRALRAAGWRFNITTGLYERGDEIAHLSRRGERYVPMYGRRSPNDDA